MIISNIIQFKDLEYKNSIVILGRVSSIRNHGKVIFLDIFDDTFKIQAIIFRFEFPDIKLNLWDIVKAEGEKVLTKSNKDALKIRKINLQSKNNNSAQKEIYSKDEFSLDNISAFNFLCNRNNFLSVKNRFLFLQYVREFLNSQNFLEVNTPILNKVPSGTEDLNSFVTFHNFLQREMHLRVAPECYLKRLIIYGFKNIFEIGPCFRNEGSSVKHIQEFHMLEAYAVCIDMDQMINLVIKMINFLCLKNNIKELNFKKISMFELISNFFNKPFSEINNNDMLFYLKNNKIKTNNKYEIAYLFLDKYLVNLIEEPTFVFDIPKSVSPLAKSTKEDEKIAFRAILFIEKIEIAEIYYEENDYKKQYEVLKKDKYIDYDFLNDLSYGMPELSGVGIGLDRLISVIMKKNNIREMLPFPSS